MPANRAWVCANCRHRVPHALSLAVRGARRSFVSLQSIADTGRDDELELPRGRKKESTAQKQCDAANRPTDAKRKTPEEFLERLFRSTGREAPATPLTLRYSRQQIQRARQDSGSGHTRYSRSKAPTGSPRSVVQGPGVKPGRSDKPNGRAKTPTLKDAVAARAFKPAHGGIHESARDAKSAGKLEPQVDNRVELVEHESEESLALPERPEPDILDFPALKPHRADLQASARKSKHEGPADPSLEQHRLKRTVACHSIWGRIRFEWTRKGYSSAVHATRQHMQDIKDGKLRDEEARLTLTQLLSLFVRYTQAELGLLVWATIRDMKFEPSVLEWSLMLQLASQQRDVLSLRSIWQSMRDARVQPDNLTWVIYLDALCGSNASYSEVTSLLQELEAQWKQSEAKDGLELGETRAERYKRSIIPFNAAIAAFFRIERQQDAHQILAWTRKIGLEPTVHTFNILLRASQRADNVAETKRLITEMESLGIVPDNVTFGTILDGILWSISADPDPVFQEVQVRKVFKEVEALGFKASGHAYTTALSMLLGMRPPNLPAARAVLAMMDEQGLKPGTHVYTVLLTHYTRGNMNIAAAESLWQRVQKENARVDSTFCSRMIEAYTACGETDRLVAFLKRIPALGISPSYKALYKALSHFAHFRERELVVDLVEDAENNRGLFRPGLNGVKTTARALSERDRFWRLVLELKKDPQFFGAGDLTGLHPAAAAPDSVDEVSESETRDNRGPLPS